ncbi:MAG: hypothetical protein NZ781_12805 [Armatimonadetes bacterium]|nr:hypothetical protein [Armatimonadota bacterium]
MPVKEVARPIIVNPSIDFETCRDEVWLFAKRLHFIGRIWGWKMLVLRDKQRNWIVTVDNETPTVLRGITLTDGEGR